MQENNNKNIVKEDKISEIPLLSDWERVINQSKGELKGLNISIKINKAIKELAEKEIKLLKE